MGATRRRQLQVRLSRFCEDHPRDSKTVGNHAKARCEESLGQRHLHLPAVCQSAEQPFGRGIIVRRKRQRKALIIRFPIAPSVGRKEGRIADPETHVHHFVLGTGLTLIWFRTLLEALKHRYLGAERLSVEFDCFLAAAAEHQIWLHLHGFPFISVSEGRQMAESGLAHRGLRAQALLLSAELGCPLRAKIFRLKDLPDFNLAILIMRIWTALHPRDCFLF